MACHVLAATPEADFPLVFEPCLPAWEQKEEAWRIVLSEAIDHEIALGLGWAQWKYKWVQASFNSSYDHI